MSDLSNVKETFLRARVKTFAIPPVHDGLVIGRKAAIGCEAFKRALPLLTPNRFEDIDLDDEIISDILIRSTFLRKIPREKLAQFVLQRLKPLMSDEDVLHLDLECESIVEEQI
ncbi:MAG: hypothetical protein AB1798_07415 [Spirochaetota bacterium]